MAAHFEHHSAATLAQAAGLHYTAAAVKSEADKASTGGMTLQNFDVLRVLGQGTILVASAGQVLLCHHCSTHGLSLCIQAHVGSMSAAGV